MELLLEDVSFHAPNIKGRTVTISQEYVDNNLKDIIEDRDLARFIL